MIRCQHICRVDETHLLRFQEVLGIVQKHLLDTRVENDAAHGTLVTGIGPSPRTMGVSKVYLDTMDCLGLVFLLGLKYKLLENRIGPCDDAVVGMRPD
jgi:hypothetical protein